MGKPSKFLSSKDRQVTFPETEMVAMPGTTKEDALRESGSTQEQRAKDLRFVPGMLLNRLNPASQATRDVGERPEGMSIDSTFNSEISLSTLQGITWATHKARSPPDLIR